MKRYCLFCLFLAVFLVFGICVTAVAETPQKEKTVPVLLYHEVADYSDVDPTLFTTLNRFRQHMIALSGAGYSTITLDDYYDHITNGKPLPQKPIIITFDDGYLGNYLYAFPVLKALGMKATIFVITDSVENENVTYQHFSWEQAREMVDSGLISIQSHTKSHQDLSTLELRHALAEMVCSRNAIERNLGTECRYLAFPYGSYTDYVQRLAKLAGYRMTMKVTDKGVNRPSEGNVPLTRLTVSGDLYWGEVLQMIEANE